MSGIGEEIGGGIGDAVTGGMAARAVEPVHGENAGHAPEAACLNCGTVLVGPYCHACGQAGHVHRTLTAFFHDLLHGVLHFEGKIWRTLPLLVWRPGRLTREYIDGRRARYVSPIALFLFVVFISFAVFSALGGPTALTRDVRVERNVAPDEPPGPAEAPATRGSGGDTQVSAIERRLESAWAKATQNPQLLIYKLQTNAYKFSWLLIPISVPFVWLLFAWRRGFAVYDHTVFVTYSISFMIALAGIATVIAVLGGGWIGALLLLYAPVHLYRQLRGTYGLARFSAAWRLLALSLFAWVAIAVFVLLLAGMAGS